MIEGQEGVTWPQWMELAQACERHGIPALFRSDHYLNLSGRHSERGSLDAWGTICALAATTTELRLGTMVSPATFRHPSLLAKLVTTADHVSGGRVELGIGAGWHEREHEAYGFPFPPTAERLEILEEQLEVLLANWGPQPASLDGDHYRLRDLDAQPKPVQQPRPPLIMGGSAGPRSVALAARFADEYNTPFPTLAQVAERRGAVAAACARAGRDPIPFSIMTSVIAGADRAELEDRLRRLERRIDLSAGALTDNPPEAWVIGTVPEAAEQLGRLAEAGVSRVMCQHLLHDDLDSVALLGREVAPLMRRQT